MQCFIPSSFLRFRLQPDLDQAVPLVQSVAHREPTAAAVTVPVRVPA
jgi:hypothetical protein